MMLSLPARFERRPRPLAPPSRMVRHAACLAAAVMVLLLWLRSAPAEPLSGSVVDGTTLQPIAGARITVIAPLPASTAEATSPGEIAVTSDESGVYQLDVPAGELELRIEAPGYQASVQKVVIEPGGRTGLVLIVFPPGLAGEVIEVESRAPPVPLPPGKTDLRRQELTRIPGKRGDALTSIKSLPGVANADANGAGPGLLVIRGAAPEDSVVTLDGVEIPLLYHFFGLQSVLPSEFISAIDFLPGGFGADQGRATGGIINISTRDEPLREIDGFAELSFINMAGFVRGPISLEHHVDFAAGVRRSFIDFLLPVVIPDDANIQFTTAPQYYDGQLRVDWRPTAEDRVTFLGLASFDLLKLLNDEIDPNEPLLSGTWENETSFTRAMLTWRRQSSRLDNRIIASLGTTGFRFEVGSDRYLRFDQRAIELREDATFKATPRLALRGGAEMYLRSTDASVRFPQPPQEGAGGFTNFSTAPLVEIMDVIDNNVSAAYVAADFEPVRGTTFTPGLRLDYYHRYDRSTLAPRLAVAQKVGEDLTLRLALGSYSRPPLQNEALQTDLQPELATQYVAGGEYNITEGIKAQLSGFYTDRRQLIVQDPVAAASMPEQSYLNRGIGRSFGAEALVRAKFDNLFGWIAYTLSRSDRIDSPEASRRLFDYDQTHNLIVVASYHRGRWEFGGRWQYSTGSPTTPVVDSIYLADANVYIPVYGAVNSQRFAAAHQLDLRLDRKWQFKTWSLSAYLDVTNVYANPRTLGYRYNFDFSQSEAIEELPLVPALGMRGSF